MLSSVSGGSPSTQDIQGSKKKRTISKTMKLLIPEDLTGEILSYLIIQTVHQQIPIHLVNALLSQPFPLTSHPKRTDN